MSATTTPETEDGPSHLTSPPPPLGETLSTDAAISLPPSHTGTPFPPSHTGTPIPPSHTGTPIPPWSDTAREYMVLERFPHLRRRLEGTLDSLEAQDREELHQLVEQRRSEVGVSEACRTPLHGKVSLLAGGNLAHVGADAVVNASNHWLTSGKGVNGALHSAAGQCLLEECLSLGGCGVGEAKMTLGYNLPASYVIHTVGPEGKDKDRVQRLRSCYESCLSLCLAHGLRTVAFSCISTGAYHYPSVEAADVALATSRQWLLTGNNADRMDRIVFVTRRPRDEEAYGFLMLAYFPLE